VLQLADAGPYCAPSKPSNCQAEERRRRVGASKGGEGSPTSAVVVSIGCGISFLLHEQRCHHLVVVVHRGNPLNTLWAVGTGGDDGGDGRFGNPKVRDGGSVDVCYIDSF
jgi:hypothetical protein